MADLVDIPEESEQLDQLQSDDTLVHRGVDDVLDEGYTAPENWSPAQGFGNTAREMREGETLDQRIAQEVPDADPDKPLEKWNPTGEKREVGSRRAGRLVDHNDGYPGEDVEAEAIGSEVGIDGGAAPAEEAAVHVIDPAEEIDEES
ncbi:DUF5709 domain-containing protein [Luteococcus sp. Sow4_B9]|uniref:DUF5709 domain-containing protein n=1 Tax=Luteococcus sp. Sow4_B9 TaxID=3438792 RepID=UPI003F975C14